MLRLLAVVLVVFSAFAAPPQDGAQTVVCFGDSLTAGHGAPSGSSYVDFLRRDLDRDGYHAKLINRGVSGNTTKDGLARLQGILAAHPAIVVLELGANDGLRGQPVAGIKRNLSIMIQAFQRRHIRVLLAGMEMPPNFGPAYTNQFDAIYPALAARYHLPLIPFLLQGVYGVEGLVSPDNLHPNAAGYRQVARTVEPYLEKMLKK